MAEITSTTGQLLFGKVLTPAGIIQEGVIAVSEEAIHYVGEAAWLPEAYAGWPAGNAETRGGLLIPGFVDVHVHGGAGFDFMYADAESLETITRFHASQGTTTMLATTMTADKKDIDRALSEVHAFRSAPMPFAQLAGVHLEGPFISPKWSGAQNPDHIVPANIEWMEQWEALYPGLIRQVTLAPEGEGALAAITWLRKHGIIAALGHTNASYEEVIAAADAGLNQAVHMFNAMTPLHHRKPGAAGAIMFDARIRAEIIADGIHVHPAAIAVLSRLKNAGNLLLITDSMSATGLSDGEYTIGDLPVLVRDGVARLKENPEALAGSTLTMIRGFRYLVEEVGLTLEEASRAASLTPAEAIGMQRTIGTLEAGKRGDILLLDEALNLRGVWIKGRKMNDIS
ncbi:N-acetylglucosamine-6-phosphate deacetylase [Paenibacillus helianthi]|uniref:N-acetylglucosamine-6-phosphate deacetylase n=1 Tax=Paenibacillus helianthi TaxID=1349432 RepID=A0ABX3EI76_9BACL|nr:MULTISPECIES: N-acetylglucosamine-6-phosphate deacetylase [Paenibacillus]OKP83345.1 N-acetylglucosamine-6-phosphate deacetylase [Paenibacillus helianthi]OKP92950.1 N-acetylglucosamine-6-phosphate deacetylase [Paenibacillus sp. P32E]